MIDYLKFIKTYKNDSSLADIRTIASKFDDFGTVSVRTTDNGTLVSVFVAKGLLNEQSTLVELVQLAKQTGYKVSRLDLCVDVQSSVLLEKEKARCTGFYSGRKGFTLYYGSRRSNVMWRVYDKRAEVEQKSRIDIGTLTRFELELKRQRAMDALTALAFADNLEQRSIDIMSAYDKHDFGIAALEPYTIAPIERAREKDAQWFEKNAARIIDILLSDIDIIDGKGSLLFFLDELTAQREKVDAHIRKMTARKMEIIQWLESHTAKTEQTQ